jgi:hypothetical protein
MKKSYYVKLRNVATGTNQWVMIEATSQADARTRIRNTSQGDYIAIGIYDDIDSAQSSNVTDLPVLNEVIPTFESLYAGGKPKQASYVPEVIEPKVVDDEFFGADDGPNSTPKPPDNTFDITTLDQQTGNKLKGPYEQTLSDRRRVLEDTSSFAAFLDEVERAGFGNLTGAAGKFVDNQYQPLASEYQLSKLMPLIRGERADEGTDRGAYLDALLRQETGDYSAFADTGIQERKDQDEELTLAGSPSFGAFLSQTLGQGGARSSQLRQLSALRDLAGMSADQSDNSFASGMLNPSDGNQASELVNLAMQALQGRYSPMVSGAIQRFAGSGDKAFADFTRGNVADVGDYQTNQEVSNFADFLGKRFGLF